jgi:hypothetical protein
MAKAYSRGMSGSECEYGGIHWIRVGSKAESRSEGGSIAEGFVSADEDASSGLRVHHGFPVGHFPNCSLSSMLQTQTM